VDDKIIANALKLGVDPMEFAKENIKIIDSAMEKLKVDKPTKELKATENIENIIEFVIALINKGFAYATEEGDVYFAVENFADYGKLSNRDLEDQFSGTRKALEENKKNPLDFALWKSAKPNEIYWESPWGKGRPGWHIECSAMNYYHLGEQIDIHGGGRDLIFPHHENEIAQTEALTGKTFAKYWLHNGLIKVNGQKMSKSLGNSICLKDILNKYDSEVIRFALLQTNYKNDINITDTFFTDALKHLLNFYKILDRIEKQAVRSLSKNLKIDEEFNEAMDDDFNTALAISNLFKYFKLMQEKLNNNDASVIEEYNAVKETYSLFGLFQQNASEFIEKNEEHEEIPEDIIRLADERWEAKKNKDYAKADELRKQILDLGYEIKDMPGEFKINKI